VNQFSDMTAAEFSSKVLMNEDLMAKVKAGNVVAELWQGPSAPIWDWREQVGCRCAECLCKPWATLPGCTPW
jgi:hypothetical protein